jgi:O-antigen/teichoic acid export membrane protein
VKGVPLPRTLEGAWLLAATGQVARFSSQAIAILVVGALTNAELFGQFMVYLAGALIYVALLDFGLPLLAQVVIPSSVYSYRRFLRIGVVIKVVLAVVVLPIPVLATWISLPYVDPLALSLFLTGALVQSAAYLITSSLRATGRYGPDALGNVASAASLFAGLLLLVPSVDLTGLAFVYFLSRSAHLGIAVMAHAPAGSSVEAPMKGQEVWLLTKRAFHYALVALLPAIIGNIDSILISGLLSAEANGEYQAVYRLALASVIVTEICVAVFLPRLAGAFGRQDPSFATQSIKALYFAVVLALFASAAFWIIGPLVVDALFPYSTDFMAKYRHLFAFLVLLRIVGMWPGLMLLVLGRERMRVIITVLALVIHVGIALSLVPRFGIGGAIWGCLISHAILYLGHFAGTIDGFKALPRSAKAV